MKNNTIPPFSLKTRKNIAAAENVSWIKDYRLGYKLNVLLFPIKLLLHLFLKFLKKSPKIQLDQRGNCVDVKTMSDFVLFLSKIFRDVNKELKLDISNRNWDTVWYRLRVKGKYVDLGPDYLYDLIEVRQHNKKADIILSVGIDLVLGTRQTCIPYNFRVCAWWKAPKCVPIIKSKNRNEKEKSF